jgi:hypothetical protein
LFNFHILLNFIKLLLLLISWLYTIVDRKDPVQFLFSLICWNFFLYLMYDLSWTLFTMYLRKMCTLQLFHVIFSICLLCPLGLENMFPCWFSVFMICPLLKYGVEVLYYESCSLFLLSDLLIFALYIYVFS